MLALARFYSFISVALALASIGESAERAGRPNLLFLLADDLRYDALGCTGSAVARTPNIDSLAKRGVSFDGAYVTTAICMTSRASIMTGQYAARHGVNSFGKPLSDEQLRESYFGQLKEAGYQLGFVGKWGVGDPPDGLFDGNFGYAGQGSYLGHADGRHLTRRLADQAEAYLRSVSVQRPFCLSVSFKAPHVDEGQSNTPFRHDPEYNQLLADFQFPKPALASAEFFESLPEPLRQSENRIRWRERFSTPELYQRSMRGYYRLVTGMDAAIGRLLRALDESDLADNTVVVFTSDHGFYLGERGFAGKWYAHDLSTRIPLFVCDPRCPESAGERRDALVLNIDLAPTLLDLAGLPVPAAMQGRPITPWLTAHGPSGWRDSFYYEHQFEYPTIPKSEAYRKGDWKYIRYSETTPVVEELYDLAADPDEEHNLASEPAHLDRLTRMRQGLAAIRKEASSPAPERPSQQIASDRRSDAAGQ